MDPSVSFRATIIHLLRRLKLVVQRILDRLKAASAKVDMFAESIETASSLIAALVIVLPKLLDFKVIIY